MSYIQTSDFVGEFKCPADQFNITLLQKAIDENENDLIRQIFGASLGNEIIAYVESPMPTNTDFDKVIDAFQIDYPGYSCECLGASMLDSKGLKFSLIAIIYRLFQTDAKLIPNQVGGLTRPNVELNNSDMLPQAQVIDKYNKAVKTIHSIQSYLLRNRETYPAANPQEFLLDYII